MNINKVCVINIIVGYVAGEQLITPMKAQLCVARATSLPSSTVDRSTGECFQQNFVYDINSLLFTMCGHYLN